MNVISDPVVAEKFENYPAPVKEKLLFLRRLILEVASEVDDIVKVTETLKWGEPSYVTKTGSTIRIDWKEKTPDKYAMYFNCRTILVDTFKEVFPEHFKFEGNRAILFGTNESISVSELKQCISLALNYHQIKHLPLLGL